MLFSANYHQGHSYKGGYRGSKRVALYLVVPKLIIVHFLLINVKFVFLEYGAARL